MNEINAQMIIVEKSILSVGYDKCLWMDNLGVSNWCYAVV